MPIVNPVIENFSFRRGDSWPPFSFNNKDENGNVIPMAGANILFQVKKKSKDTAALQTFTETAGLLIENDVATIDSANLPPCALEVGQYVYDIQFTLTNGIVKTTHAGTIKINQDTSR